MRRLLFLLAAFAAFFAACGSGGDDAATTQAPAAPTASAKVDLSKDDLGRVVNVITPARRIVAMSPSIVELMYAVGATPVGRPSSADYPEAAKSLPAFGTAYQPNYEEIAALKPDLIVADAVIHKDTINDIARLGFPVFAVRVNSFDDVTAGLRKVGALTGNSEAGEREAKKLDDKLAAIVAKKPATSPSVIVVVAGGPTQLFAGLNDSYVGDVLKKLGARNVLSSEPETFRLPGFSDYSIERLVEKNPDVIIAISPGRPNITTQAMSASPVYSSLKAVKGGRVHEVDPVVYIQSAGPRVSQILDELSRILYPDVFKAS